MDDRKNGCRISRRVLLTTSALAAGAASTAVLIPQAKALQQITQTTAAYQGAPKGDQHCALCFNFQPPGTCKFVQGDISANGWCQLFAAKA